MAQETYQMSLTLEDRKGQKSVMSFTLLLDDATALSDLPGIVATVKNLISPLTDCVIRGGAFSTLPVAVNYTDEAADGADVEEGALFIWRTAQGITGRTRVPGFKESQIEVDSREVEVTGNVATFVNAMISGTQAPGPINVVFADGRGFDIIALESAKEQFVRSR